VLLVNDGTTRGIEEDCIWLHVRQKVLVHHVLSLSCSRGMNADNITFLKKIFKA
jgi:hypothetical protein